MESTNTSILNNNQEVENLEEQMSKIQIGYGVSSEVYLFQNQNNDDQQAYVHKQFKKDYPQADIQNESEIHQLIKSKHVIKLYEARQEELVLEHAANGDLLEYVRYSRFTEKLARTFFIQLISGMSDIHRENICHRDIKLDNLLLTEDFELKITDFGWSSRYKDNQMLTERAGTEDVFPPEMIEYRPYSPLKVDVFLCGLVLFTMVCGMSPIHQRAKKNDKLYKYFANNMSHLLWKGLKEKRDLEVSEEFKNLIQQMIHHDYKSRLDFNQILEHEWILKGDIYEVGSDELKNEMNKLKKLGVQVMIEKNTNQQSQEEYKQN